MTPAYVALTLVSVAILAAIIAAIIQHARRHKEDVPPYDRDYRDDL